MIKKYYKLWFKVDRRGESEESGDDETKRKSLNGEVDSLQAPSTGEWDPHWFCKKLKTIKNVLYSTNLVPYHLSPFHFSTWGVTRWHGHHNLRPRWRGDWGGCCCFFREFRQMMLLLANSLHLIYSGCGSGPLSHWKDWGSGGSPEGKGESIKGWFFR